MLSWLLVFGLASLTAALCASTCLSCTSTTGMPWECISCQPGLYLQPDSAGLCFNYCPTGYTLNPAGTCDSGTHMVIVTYILDRITPTIKDISSGWVALNGATMTYYPPTFEEFDPVPAKQRGYFFTGNSYVALPPESGSGNPSPLQGANFAVLAWFKTTLISGYQTILGKNIPSASDEIGMDALVIYLRTDLKLAVTIHTMTVLGAALNINTWYCLAVSVSFDSTAGKTTITLYIDNTVYATQSFLGLYPYEDIGVVTSIGQEYDIGNVRSDFFRGFIWEVKMWNYATDVTTLQSEFSAVAHPVSLAVPLSSCGFSQYLTGVNTCSACAASCTLGCVRGSDCYYCSDPLCTYCTSFDVGSCQTCKLNSSLVAGGCTCNSRYFYNAATLSCNACYGTCLTCVGSASNQCTSCSANAVLSAGSCACTAGYFYPTLASGTCIVCVLVYGVCQCPVGYYMPAGGPYCILCGAFCSTYQTGVYDGCAQCYTSATLDYAAEGTCLCTPGTYFKTTTETCPPCDGSCATCVDGTSTGCLTCNAGMALTSAPPGACGYVPSTVGCDLTCYSCINATPQGCAQCFPDSYLHGISSVSIGECRCAGSFYRPAAVSLCSPCDSTCATCTNGLSSGCTNCFDDSYLSGGKCLCSGSYFRAAGYCAPCNCGCLTCVDGTANGCTSCSADSYFQAVSLPTVGKCICSGSFYRSALTCLCASCDLTCLLCQGGGTTDCTQCYPDSSLTPALVGTCVCNGSFYRPPGSGVCQACSNTCFRCVDGTLQGCTQCYPDSLFYGLISTPAIGQCVCIGSFYHSPSTGVCLACDPTCVSCTDGSMGGCTSCFSNSYLSSNTIPPVGQCVCLGRFYHPPNSSLCLPCYIECLSCSGGTALSCTQCYQKAYLNSLAPGRCVCDFGYSGGPDTSNCLPCDSSCASCVGLDAFQCSSCPAPTALVTTPVGVCSTCPTGTYYEADECHLCPTGCSACVSAKICIECFPSFFLHPDSTCQISCPASTRCLTDPKSSNCFSASMIVNTTNELVLVFSTNLSQPLTAADVRITIGFENGTRTDSIAWELKEIMPTWEYFIGLNSTELISSNSSVALTFLNATSLVSTSCAGLSTPEITSVLNGTKQNSDDAPITQWKPAAQSVIVVLVCSSVVLGSSTLLWMFINNMQLISYIPLSNIPLSSSSRRMMIDSNPISYIPNLLDYLYFNQSNAPEHAQNCDFVTSSFIHNIGAVLLVLVIMIGVVALLVFFRVFPLFGAEDYISKQLSEFRWNRVLRFALVMYLPVAMAAGLQVYDVFEVSPYDVLSSTFALCNGVAIASFVVLCWHQVHQSKRKTGETNTHWGTLTSELKTTQISQFGRYYYMFFTLRRLFYSCVQAFLQDHPQVQGVFNIIHCMWVCLMQFLLYTYYSVQYSVQLDKWVSLAGELASVLLFAVAQVFFVSMNTYQTTCVDAIVLSILVSFSLVSVAASLWKVWEKVAIIIKKPASFGATHVLPGGNNMQHLDTHAESLR